MEGNSQQGEVPLFRWYGWHGLNPQLEWLQCPEDQLPAIRDLLQVQFERVWDLSMNTDDIAVESISGGAWNRAFKVTLPPDLPLRASTLSIKNQHHQTPATTSSSLPRQYFRYLVLRLSVPVLQSTKTHSEVATIGWVRQHTKIPVPRVFLYDATGSTFGGYEWILMEHMPGQPYYEVQDRLPTEAKAALARTVADNFYMGDWRPEYPFPRGPFRDLRRFCSSFIEAAHHELHDPRQQQRESIFSLSQGLFFDDHENSLQLPNASKYVSEETPAAKLKRQRRVARYKAELTRIFEGLSATTHLEGSCARKVIEARHVDDIKDREPVGFVVSIPGGCSSTAAGPENGQKHDRQVHGLVSLHFARGAISTEAHNRLNRLVEDVVPDSPLPPRCSILHHWDISAHNVLVDPDNGRPTALLDWEQLFTAPILPLIANTETEATPGPADCLPYPRLMRFEYQMELYTCSREPSLSWIPASKNEEDLSSHRRTWGIQVMRAAYRARLEELVPSSPPSCGTETAIGEGGQQISHGGGDETTKPGMVEPSSSRFLSDRDQLVEQIIAKVQDWDLMHRDVQKMVEKAQSLGYCLDVSDLESEAPESETDKSELGSDEFTDSDTPVFE
ncbi:hypothetical protein PG997_005747 [Apiospora hydei]|uniref:Aminoglycoside phosphotransferase domain-containing protein n=1 Tax=Apiospora hydei TaxID=1337664 RepID=A0ABR1WLQ8_9PEZI